MIKFVTLTILLFFSFNLVAQKKKKADAQLLADRAEWFEGSIMLNDGNELKGLVKYNSRQGLISFQDGAEARVFTPIRVAGFEFFDEYLQKQRIFYTLEYEDSEANVRRPLFFEVLKEYKNFAVLSKADRLDIDQKREAPNTFSPGFNGNSNDRTVITVSQTETVYLMKVTGEIKPYFKATQSEDGSKSLFKGNDTKTKNKMIDRDLLEEFISPSDYKKLTEYAMAHNLSFKKKDEFMQILGHYDNIIEK